MFAWVGVGMSFQNEASKSSHRQNVVHSSEKPSMSPLSRNPTSQVLQLAKTIGNKAMIQFLQKQRGSKRPQMPVIQGKFKDIEATDYSSNEYYNNPNNEGQFTSVLADKGLPTYYGVLKDTYGEENVNKLFFSRTIGLGDTCDRPHSVSAVVKINKSNSIRLGDTSVSAIGNLGTEERLIRDGKKDSVVTEYDGGHLVGYQIVRGIEANQPWNIAPQDSKNNEHSYNNTIEKMLRGASDYTEYVYTVDVKYDQLNFSVDQEQLVQQGILKQVDSTKPWEIQLPVRIPFKWDARAEMTNKDNADWQFGSPTEGDSSLEQYSQTMDEGNLDSTKVSHTARFNLSFSNKDGHEYLYDIDSNNFKPDKVKGIRYSMHQSLPTDFLKNKEPKDWQGNETDKVANFGEVTKGLASKSTNILEVVKTKLTRNKILINEIEEIEDVEKPERMKFIPDGLLILNKSEKKCVFIAELDERKIRNEYKRLKNVEQNYYHLFDIQPQESTAFKLKKEELNNIDGDFTKWVEEFATEKEEFLNRKMEDIRESVKTLEEQTLMLTQIKNHRTGRKIYQQTVAETYPLYKEKIFLSLEVVQSMFGYDNMIEYYKGSEKTDSKNKLNLNGKRKLDAKENTHKKSKHHEKEQEVFKKKIDEAKKMYWRKSVEDYLNNK
ncbi:hypothetical protein [Brevibacillus sp. 179-C 1.1 NHS]|uniref:hypothetical protein n=1 Tax=Brevibacillus sp. 179-C 1.1 NHS TaxID=3235177 RepID=UPI0039A07B4E